MRINTNLAALATRRYLGGRDAEMATAMQRLSSGLRVNRAADDAASLTIAQKIRARTLGYAQAQRNAQDAISMVQTAEGALGQIQAMLQRVRELAVQAANDTLTIDDREAISSEMMSLKAEINGISERTQFNGKALLDGSLGGTRTTQDVSSPMNTMEVGDIVAADPTAPRMTLSAAAVIGTGTPVDGTYGLKHVGSEFVLESQDGGVVLRAPEFPSWWSAPPNQVFGVAFTSDSVPPWSIQFPVQAGPDGLTGDQVNLALDYARDGQALVVSGGAVHPGLGWMRPGSVLYASDKHVTITDVDVSGAPPNVTSFIFSGVPDAVQISHDGTTYTAAIPDFGPNESHVVDFGALGIRITLQAGNAAVRRGYVRDGLVSPAKAGIATTGSTVPPPTFQVGASAMDSLSVSFDRVDIRADSPGALSTLNDALDAFAAGLDSEMAQDVLSAVDGAISDVSAARASLGASQNRLEHALEIAATSGRDAGESESRLVDADLAVEAARLASRQVLREAGVQVLTRASDQARTILRLLES